MASRQSKMLKSEIQEFVCFSLPRRSERLENVQLVRLASRSKKFASRARKENEKKIWWSLSLSPFSSLPSVFCCRVWVCDDEAVSRVCAESSNGTHMLTCAVFVQKYGMVYLFTLHSLLSRCACLVYARTLGCAFNGWKNAVKSWK
jgi:uncharacterized protein YaeQ